MLVGSGRRRALPGDGPHEGDELASDSRGDGVGMFAPRPQPTVALAQAHLGTPADVLDVFRQMLLASLDGLGDLGQVAISFGGFNEGAASMRVATLGNPAEPTTIASGVLARCEPEVGSGAAYRSA